ncbi:MAG: hypothetical protein WAT65_03970, partial [Candidatus Nanopelagicales bacterium]
APAEVLANPATPFVAEFTGTDRSLKLLAVTPVESGELEAAGPEASSLDNVPADCSLREALAVLLDSPVGRVSVGDPANPDGVLTMDGVFRALRISTDDLPSSSVA